MTNLITSAGGNVVSMKELLAKTAFDLPKVGQTITGEIISVSKNSVLVDLGPLGTGIVYPAEFYDNTNLQKELKPGQTITAILLDIENESGMRELSLKHAQLTTAWEDIKNKKESGEVIGTKVININKGGAIVEINGVPGFLPLSQLSPEHYPKVDGGDTTKIVQALQKLRNTEVKVKIIDYFEDENRLIVSEKAINDQQLLAEVSAFKVGDIVTGTITDVTDFGAFVKLSENLEGLVHISEIAWKLIDDPREFLTTGENIEAKIVDISGTKISLSRKALLPDPWLKIQDKYSVGQTLIGTISKLTNYGAFVRLDEEISGLIPASEFGDKKPSEIVTVGDHQSVAIVSIDPTEHKLLLTLQNAEKKPDQN